MLFRSRPGRPKKNATPPAAQGLSEPALRGLRHDELPPGTLPLDIKRPE